MKRTGAWSRAISACTVVLLLAMAAPAASALESPPTLEYDAWGLSAMDTETGDRFGSAVAVWGDLAIIGAPQENDGQGAAYIFQRVGPSWIQRAKLTAVGGAAQDAFGFSVAISGGTALVGAPGDDEMGLNSGSAYIFTGSGDSWSPRSKFTASDGAADDHFGFSVAISGGTALVGATGDDDEGPNAGAAYVFTGSGAWWKEKAKLTAEDGGIEDAFGCSLALSGGTALIGAPFVDSGVYEDSGAAYIFTGSGDSWSQRATLTASEGDDWDTFGVSVALSDGTALIGASGDDDMGLNSGSAYVFTGAGASWSQRAKLHDPDGVDYDQFGHPVALSGGTAVVGATGYDGHRGAAHVFTGAGSSWTRRIRLTHPGGGAVYDAFGYSVAVSGGMTIVGVVLDDTPRGTDAGSAVAYTFASSFLPGASRIAGTNRYLTAVAASKQGFPTGAPAVVIATGENWPDALGGSALAGAAYGPLLLTRKDAMPAEVTAEIKRLGAVKAYVLGSTASVSSAVEEALVGMMGRANVVRLGGSDRYATARLVADETIRLRGFTYAGIAFVATGSNYPDATAASPFAAWRGAPILLANVRTGALYVPPQVTRAVILGSTAAVPASFEASLKDDLGDANVTRLGGINRYATAALVAQAGVAAGMRWNGVGLAVGTNFPDALAAGPMLATQDSVLLLTRPDILSGEAYTKLSTNATTISSIFIFGDTNAVSAAVETAAKKAAGL